MMKWRYPLLQCIDEPPIYDTDHTDLNSDFDEAELKRDLLKDVSDVRQNVDPSTNIWFGDSFFPLFPEMEAVVWLCKSWFYIVPEFLESHHHPSLLSSYLVALRLRSTRKDLARSPRMTS